MTVEKLKDKDVVVEKPVKPPLEERSVTYIPLGATEKMELKFEYVRDFLVEPTKTGRKPTNADIIKFMKLCEARQLNPWEGDAYCVGYDTKIGDDQYIAKFSLITAAQALLKRAEQHQAFDGLQSGIIVARKGDIETIEREGNFYMFGDETVVGGWAKVYRSDRKTIFYASVPLTVYAAETPRWKKDPGGMIEKVAQARALRTAFPSQLAQLYLREEFAATLREQELAAQGAQPKDSGQPVPKKPLRLTDISKELETRGLVPKNVEGAEPVVAEKVVAAGADAVKRYLAEIDLCNDQDVADSIYRDVNEDTVVSAEQRNTVLEYLKKKMG